MASRVAIWCDKHPRFYQRIELKVRKPSDHFPQGAMHTVTVCRMCKSELARNHRAKGKFNVRQATREAHPMPGL